MRRRSMDHGASDGRPAHEIVRIAALGTGAKFQAGFAPEHRLCASNRARSDRPEIANQALCEPSLLRSQATWTKIQERGDNVLEQSYQSAQPRSRHRMPYPISLLACALASVNIVDE